MNMNLTWLVRAAVAALAVLLPGGRSYASATGNGAADIRRDATVEAIEQAMPCVVNIATATLVERNDDYYRMLRAFYGDRIQRQVRAMEIPQMSGCGRGGSAGGRGGFG